MIEEPTELEEAVWLSQRTFLDFMFKPTEENMMLYGEAHDRVMFLISQIGVDKE